MTLFNDIKKILQSIPHHSLFQMEMLIDISIKDTDITLIIEVPNHIQNKISEIQEDILNALKKITEKNQIKTLFTSQKPIIQKRKTSSKIELPQIKNVIAVASGKGGVGKSTTALNLALALKEKELKVGLMDGDIYGPSVPKMINVHEKPQMQNGQFLPIQKMGIHLISMGLLIDPSQPLVWRGPMVQTAIKQLLRDVAWGELDVLIIDMPPGTGDIHLTIAQSCPLTGVIIVTTPQDLALIDAIKGLEMFRKMGIPILGIIENMSLYQCPNCNHLVPIFGNGGAKELSKNLGIPFLGSIPLDMDIRISGDGKTEDNSWKIQKYYQKIAESLAVYF